MTIATASPTKPGVKILIVHDESDVELLVLQRCLEQIRDNGYVFHRGPVSPGDSGPTDSTWGDLS